MTGTLLELAGHPECHAELRSEIEESVAAHSGWTLDALDSMHKLDSFMKESQRMRPLTQSPSTSLLQLAPADRPPLFPSSVWPRNRTRSATAPPPYPATI